MSSSESEELGERKWLRYKSSGVDWEGVAMGILYCLIFSFILNVVLLLALGGLI